MLIKKIALENIRSYPKLHLDMPTGYVLLEGDVGAGKSTILMAIEFALFGLGEMKPDSLISKGKSRGEVALTFEVDGIQYEVGRTLLSKNGKINQDPKGAYLSVDGQREPLTASDLKSRILQVLNFREPSGPRSHSRVYRYAVYTPQEEIKAILGNDASREEAIRRAFGIEDYETVVNNAKTLRQKFSTDRAELSGRFAKLEEYCGEQESQKTALVEMEDSLEEIFKNKNIYAAQIAQAKARQSILSQQMDDMTRIDAERNHTKREIGRYNGMIDDCKDRLEKDRADLVHVNQELDQRGSPQCPTSVSAGELQESLEKIESEEKSILSKEADDKNCRSRISDIEEELGEIGILECPTSVSAGELQESLEKIESEEKSILSKEADDKNCRSRISDIEEELGEIGILECPTSVSAGELQESLEKIESEEKSILSKEADDKNCRSRISDIEEELGEIGILECPTSVSAGELQESLEKIESEEKSILSKEADDKNCRSRISDIEEELGEIGILECPTSVSAGELQESLEKIESEEKSILSKEADDKNCRSRISDIEEELGEIGILECPTSVSAGELQESLEKIESEEKSILSKEADDKNCRSRISDIEEELGEIGILECPTSVSAGELQESLEKIESEEKSILSKEADDKNCRSRISDIEEELGEIGILECPTSVSAGELQARLEDIERVERNILSKESEARACVVKIKQLSGKIGERTLESILNEISSLEKGIENHERNMSMYEGNLRNHSVLMGSISNTIHTLEDILDKTKDLGGRCDYCDSTLDEKYVAELQSKRRDKLNEARQEKESIARKISQNTKSREDAMLQLNRHRITLKECQEAQVHAMQKRDQGWMLEGITKELEQLDAEKYVPQEQPIAREENESSTAYVRRLQSLLQSYETKSEKKNSLLQQKDEQEKMLEGITKELEQLDAEKYVPQEQPIAREENESSTAYVRRLQSLLQSYETKSEKKNSLLQQKDEQEKMLEGITKELEQLDAEKYVPQEQPIAREENESSTAYVRRLQSLLQSYETKSEKKNSLLQQKDEQEKMLEGITKELEQLDAEKYVPQEQPIAREENESSTAYVRRLQSLLQSYETKSEKKNSLLQQKDEQEKMLEGITKELEQLDAEKYVPQEQPIAREENESSTAYVRRLQSLLQSYETKSEKKNSLLQQKDEQEKMLEGITKELEQLDAEKYVPQEQPIAREENESSTAYVRRLQSLLQSYETKSEKKNSLLQQKDEQEKMLEGITKELEQLDAEKYVPQEQPIAREENESSTAYVRRLQSLLQSYETKSEKKNSLLQQKDEQEKMLEGITKELEQLDAEKYVPQEQPIAREENESSTAYVRRLQSLLQSYETDIRYVKEQEERKESLESDIDKEETNLVQYRQEDEKLQGSLIEAERQLQGRDTLQKDIDENEKEMDEVMTSLEKERDEESRINERISNTKSVLDKLDTDIQEARVYKAEHDKCQDYVEWLNMYFVPTVAAIESRVMESLRYDFNDSYSEWYATLVDDPTKNSYINEKFAPVLEQDGYQQNVDYLSGGEKTSVALAYRLAINSTMRRQTQALKSNLIILDEPTDGFSREQMNKVRVILESLKSQQVIMVSHEKELEGYVDHVFQITKNEGVSSVQRIR